MSFDINWDNIGNDSALNLIIKNQLSSYLQSISLPSYVRNLQITDFSLGKIAPKITLKEINDPLQDFYDALNEDLDSSCDDDWVAPSPSDVQFLIEVEYTGDLLISLSADLVLNYPSKEFITLPLKFGITDLGIHSLCLVAYMSKQIFISFLCDVSDPILDNDTHNTESILDPNGSLMAPKRPFERISIIRSLKIDTEIGEQLQGEGSILKNVGKLEQFLLEKFKDLLRQELAWPSWINLDMTGEEDVVDAHTEQND
ncbi:ERMES complex subunit MDM12 NDAI_0C02720 [Naumovozyma dairenensis CBS 421]|uniref:Mitochondrial distribution and morphology protein 12 n=1 Tax=Naumovozyma dairenensis (strain ATCC 10597 / BCRC 20456 / CBS 421 / NBRC 0211 / NRRL Y-12639) TaxID=1071378 RepID=G0W821_NAUDC|nr:hypothetical protein NDAI_0C02720 [Naumovozyma dairenensis CBS 421]CCD23932.1 hypothetical protein NDAI_0C02720 [Naumovozyma dairenensis CBS 421]